MKAISYGRLAASTSRRLVLGGILTSVCALALPLDAASQLARKPFIETIEFTAAPNAPACQGPGHASTTWINAWFKIIDCDGSAAEASLTTAEIAAYTGIPYGTSDWHCNDDPGPTVVNLCDQKQDPLPCTSSQADRDRDACVGDPVNVTTGELDQSVIDVDLGDGLRFERHYASARAALSASGPLGRTTWQHGLEWSIDRTTTPLGTSLVIVDPPLRAPVAFLGSAAGGAFQPSQRGEGALVVDPDGTAHYTSDDGTRAHFSTANVLTGLQPAGAPEIAVATSGATVSYSNGAKQIEITTTSGRISTVVATATPPGGAPVVKTWTYTYTTAGHLGGVSGPDPSGSGTLTWAYGYDPSNAGRLTSVSRNGQGIASWTHGGSPPRVLTADEPTLARPVGFAYETSGSGGSIIDSTTVSDASGVLAVFDVDGDTLGGVSNPAGPANPTGSAPVVGGAGLDVRYVSGTQDALGRWRTRTDQNGHVTLFESYDARGNAGRIVEGWVPQQPGATSFAPGDTFARRREFEHHPTLNTPTVTTEVSAVTGVFGDLVTTLDYDDPADDAAPAIPNSEPTTRVYRRTRAGKTRTASGSITSFTDVTTYGYNAAGQLVTVHGPYEGPSEPSPFDAPHTEIGYTAGGLRSSVSRHPQGPTSTPLVWSFSSFDAQGNPQAVTDPNGNITTFLYDALSRVKEATPPYPAAEHAGAATSSKLTFSYDAAGNLTQILFPDDDQNQPVWLSMEYDARNRLTLLKDSQANAIAYVFVNGVLDAELRYRSYGGANQALVGKAEFAHDSADRLVKAFNPLFADDSVFSEILPDGRGNPHSIKDENGREDVLLFDALDRLAQIQQIRSMTYETQFAYDALSNVTRVTDAAGKPTDLLHDDRGHLVETLSPDTGRTRFVYDAAGNLVTKIENAPATGTQNARITSYAYDGLNRLLSIDLPNDLDWIFTYDTDAAPNQKGRLASVTNGVVTTELAYMQRGDVARERTIVDGFFYDVHYAYDAAGNRVRIETPSQHAAETEYAGLRPSDVSITAGSRVEWIHDLAWYPFGPRTSALLPPRDASGANTVTSERTVNLRGQITEIDVFRTGAAFVDRSFTYDFTAGAPGPNDPGPNLDRVIDHLDAAESRFYFYDALDRLEKATDLSGNVLHQLGYDAVGNRTSKLGPLGSSGYTYEANTNRLDAATGAEARDYTHDAYGNRIWDHATAYAGTPRLVYDDANRLTQVLDPGDDFAVLATYTYDAFGRRVKKQVGDAVALFFYDIEGHLVEEVQKIDGAADLVRTYVFVEDELVALVDRSKNVGTAAWVAPAGRALEIDPRLLFAAGVLLAGLGAGLATRRVPVGLATTTSGAALLLLCAGSQQQPRMAFVHTDALGTPIAVTNAPTSASQLAKVVWKASYEPFGKADPIEDPDGDTVTFSLAVRFPGQYEDAETGSHYNFFRTFDPSTGRYLEADLIDPPRSEQRTLGRVAEVPTQGIADQMLDALLPYRLRWAGRVDPRTGQVSELGLPASAIASTSGYAYAGSDPIGWIDPLGDSKSEGVKRGGDEFLTRFRAAQGNREAICKVEKDVEQLWKAGRMSKQRYSKARAWAKLARRNELRSAVPLACTLTTLCTCAEHPESCAAMFDDQ